MSWEEKTELKGDNSRQLLISTNIRELEMAALYTIHLYNDPVDVTKPTSGLSCKYFLFFSLSWQLWCGGLSFKSDALCDIRVENGGFWIVLDTPLHLKKKSVVKTLVMYYTLDMPRWHNHLDVHLTKPYSTFSYILCLIYIYLISFLITTNTLFFHFISIRAVRFFYVASFFFFSAKQKDLALGRPFIFY